MSKENTILLFNAGNDYQALFESITDDESDFFPGAAKGEKKWKIKGKFMEVSKNSNGRTYSAQLLEPAIAEYNRDYIARKRSLGCLNHPNSVHTDLQTVSHGITKLTWDPNDKCGYGEAVILDTVSGIIAQNIFKGGFKLDISSRGPGRTDKNTGEVLEWICFGADLVDIPSNENCYIDAIFESKNQICNMNPMMERNYKRLEKNYSSLHKSLLVSQFIRSLKEE